MNAIVVLNVQLRGIMLFSPREPPASLSAIFAQRRDSFLESLQHILSAAGSDIFIRQMFDDRSSAVFVPDRICEIVQHCILDDREKYLEEISSRLRAIEACFGQTRIKKFEEIGNSILEMRKNQNGYENERNKLINSLRSEFKKLTGELDESVDRSAIKGLCEKVEEIDHEQSLMRASVDELLNGFIATLKNARDHSLKIIENFQKSRMSQVESLKSELSQLKDGNNEKIDMLNESIQKNLELVDEKEKEIEQLKSTIFQQKQSMSNENSKLQNLYLEMESKNKQLKRKLDTNEELINNYEEEKLRVEQRLKETLQEVREKDLEISELQQSISLLPSKDETKIMNDEISRLEADLELSRQKLKEASSFQAEKNYLNEALKNAKENNNELKSKIEEQNSIIQNYQQQVESMKQNFEKIKGSMPERKALVSKIGQLTTKLQKAVSKTDSIKSDYDKLVLENKQLQFSLKGLNDQLKEKNSTIQKIREDMDTSISIENEKDMTISKQEEKMREYDSALKLLVKKMKNKETQLNNSMKENKSLKEELLKTQNDLLNARNELSISNNTVDSLKDELELRTSTIDNFQSTLRESSLQAQDLSTALEKIKHQSSVINNCEDRNGQLMREISYQEERITALNERLIEKDKQLKKALQEKLMSDRRNETLDNLNRKQARELEDTHARLTDMHTRLLKYESDVFNNNDSLKKMTIDNDRISKERSIVQENLSKERGRYRNEINGMQQNLTDLQLENTDLHHKVDELTYENKNLSALLDSKEYELSFEKRRYNEEINNMRNLASRRFDESSLIQNNINELESNNRNILNEFKKLLNIDSFDDLPKKIKQFQVEQNKKDETLEKVKKVFRDRFGYNTLGPNGESFDDLEALGHHIEQLKEERDELHEKSNKMRQLLNLQDGDEIFDEMTKLKNENENLKRMEDSLKEVFGGKFKNRNPNRSDLINAIYTAQQENENFKKQNEQLKSFLPIDPKSKLNPSFDIVSEFKNEISKNSQNTDLLSTIANILDEDGDAFKINSPNKKSPAVALLDKINNLKAGADILEKIMSLTECSNADSIPNVIVQIMNENRRLNDELDSIKDITRMNDLQSSGKKLSSTVAKIMKENDRLKSEITNGDESFDEALEKLKEVKKDSEAMDELKKQMAAGNTFGFNGPVTARDVLKRFQKMQDNENQLQEMLQNVDAKDINSAVQKLLNENERLKQSDSNIAKALEKSPTKSKNPAETISELIQQNDELKSAYDSIRRSFPTPLSRNETIQDKINDLFEENKELKQMIDYASSVLPPGIKGQTFKEKINNFVSQNREMVEEKRKIENILPPSRNNNTSLEERVNNLLKENNDYKQTQRNISKIIPLSKIGSNSPEDIESQVKEFVQQNEILKNEQKKALMALPLSIRNNFKDNLPELIQAYSAECENIKDQFNNVSKILPGDKNEPVHKRLSNLLSENAQLKEKERKSKALLADFTDDEDLEVAVRKISNNLHRLESVLPPLNGDNFADAVEDLVKEKDALEHTQKLCDEILMQSNISAVQGDLSLPEKVQALIEENEAYKEKQKKIESLIFNDGEPLTSIEDRIIEILTESQELKQNEEELMKLLPEELLNSSNGTPSANKLHESFRDIISEKDQLTTERENIQNLLNQMSDLNDSEGSFHSLSSAGKGSLEYQIKKLIQNNADLKSQLDEARQSLPEEFRNGDKATLKSQIESLVDAMDSLKAERSKVAEILAPGVNSEEVNLANAAQSLLSTMDGIKKILPPDLISNSKDGVENITDILRNVVGENYALKEQKHELQNLLSTEGTASDLKAKLQQLLNEKSDLQQRLERIVSLLPGPPTTMDDIIEQLHCLIDNNIELKELRNDIERLLNGNANQKERFLSRLDKLANDNQLKMIRNMVDQNSLLKIDSDKYMDIVKTIKSYDEKLDDLGPKAAVNLLIQESDHYRKLSQLLFEKLHCDSPFDSIKEIEALQHNLETSIELNQHLFDAISASAHSPVRIVFPMTEQRKISLFKIIDSAKQKIIELQRSSNNVIDRAKRSGFNGDTLEESVHFLEQRSAFAEQQKQANKFKEEIEELRGLNGKQQAMADQYRDKFRRRLQEKIQYITELQEHIASREDAAVTAIEEEKKKVRQLEIIADKNKRIIEELLRVMNGRGADIDFLRSNLTTPDASVLQYANTIHQAVLKAQNYGALGT